MARLPGMMGRPSTEDLGLACPSSRVCRDQSGDGSVLVIQFNLGVNMHFPAIWGFKPGYQDFDRYPFLFGGSCAQTF